MKNRDRIVLRFATTIIASSLSMVSRAEDNYCFVTYDNLVPYKTIGASGAGPRDVTVKAAEFLEMFRYDREFIQRGEKQYFKLYRANTEFGYVSRDYLLFKTAPWGVGEKFNDRLTGKPYALYRKVRLANSQDYLAQIQKEDKDLADAAVVIPVLSSPEAGGNARHRYRLSNIFYVYGEVENYFLIGSQPEFTAAPGVLPTDVKSRWNVIKGWVPKSRSIEWNTRLALEWNWDSDPSSLPALMFSDGGQYYDEEKTFEHVSAFLTDFDATRKEIAGILSAGQNDMGRLNAIKQRLDQERVYSYEPFDVRQGGFRFLRMLPHEPRTLLLDDVPLVERDPLLKDFHAYKVAATSGFRGTISDAERRSQQELVKQVQDRLKRLNVLIVVDATSSMRPYIVSAVQAIVALSAEFQGEKELSEVNFSIAFYRDYEDKESNWYSFLKPAAVPSDLLASRLVQQRFMEVQRKLALERPESARSIRDSTAAFDSLISVADNALFRMLKLAHAEDALDGGDTVEESCFKALDQALQDHDLQKPHNGMDAVILIADAGDNGKARLTAKDIERLFVGSGTQVPRALSVINVSGVPGRLDGDFNGVISAINRAFNARAEEQVEVAKRIEENNPARVASLVKEQVAAVRRRALESLPGIEEVLQGNFTADLTQTAKQMLKENGVDPDKLKDIEGAEIFRVAMLPYKMSQSGTRNKEHGTRTNVLLRDYEVTRLRDAIDGVVGVGIGNQKLDQGSLRDILTRAVENMTGQTDTKMSFSEALEAVVGMPATSPLMKSGEEFDSLFEEKNAEKLRQELRRLTEVKHRLDDVLANRYTRLSWIKRKNSEGFEFDVLAYQIERPFNPMPAKRSFTFPDGVTVYCWIDVELEFP